MDEKTVAFIMAERLTHENLKSNPWAAYLFMEAGGGWSGKRVYLKKLKEEQNEELIQEICRKCDYSRYDVKNRFIVYFSVENVLPLIGSQEVRLIAQSSRNNPFRDRVRRQEEKIRGSDGQSSHPV